MNSGRCFFLKQTDSSALCSPAMTLRSTGTNHQVFASIEIYCALLLSLSSLRYWERRSPCVCCEKRYHELNSLFGRITER